MHGPVRMPVRDTTLHELLDFGYGPDGDTVLSQRLRAGADPNARSGPYQETPLHVAARRYRPKAVRILLQGGSDIDARTKGGKTAYAHAVRRGFHEVADLLLSQGASGDLDDADRFAIAIVEGRYDDAWSMLARQPDLARTGNPEEDRILADVSGRGDVTAVKLLLDAGADLTAPGLDSGTPLHQAAWFGQPANARLLIAAEAPLDVFEPTHQASPIGWAVHGSRYSGGAEDRQPAYVALVKMLLDEGSSLYYPDEPGGDRYLRRLLRDASPPVREALERRPT